MADFSDLGLREELLNVLLDEDITRPTALQHAVIPVLRRGGNLVARAATGSGKTLAYTLGVLDRVRGDGAEEDEEDGSSPTRVLIVRPTTEAAEATAVAAFPYAQAAALNVAVPGGSWGTAAQEAGVVVGTPATVLEAVRASALKLDAVEAVIVDGGSAVDELGQTEALETVLDNVPRDAQRVLLTEAFPTAVSDLIDRRVKRALRYPAEPAVPEQQFSAPEARLGYLVVLEAHKLELLSRALTAKESGGAAPVLFFRTDERAASIAEQLTVRGFVIGELGDEDSDVVLATAGVSTAELVDESGEEAGQTISYDVPADEESLRARHAGDEHAIVLVEPAELTHLRMIAERARLALHSVTIPVASPALREVEEFRDQLRAALRTEDLGAQLLLLEPLLQEHSAAEIAAVATALLRRRAPAAAPAPGAPTTTSDRAARADAEAPRAAARARAGTDAGPPPSTYARLYIGVGNRDGVRTGDLVGAIAGEANIPGSSIGKIEIRDTFSIAEVPAGAADAIIRAINGTTIKGRSVRVDYDRAGDRARKPPQRRAGRPEAGGRETRRTPTRRPPRT